MKLFTTLSILLCGAFVYLKLTGVLVWSWWAVTAPVSIPFIGILSVILYLQTYSDKWKK